nr:unnamed protein product [Digitaria exilis]CAB3480421.1 unnamed protein product [Digitaria exilis]CAB3482602.1 unnamed protein product [Digitaria exilis]
MPLMLPTRDQLGLDVELADASYRTFYVLHDPSATSHQHTIDNTSLQLAAIAAVPSLQQARTYGCLPDGHRRLCCAAVERISL